MNSRESLLDYSAPVILLSKNWAYFLKHNNYDHLPGYFSWSKLNESLPDQCDIICFCYQENRIIQIYIALTEENTTFTVLVESD